MAFIDFKTKKVVKIWEGIQGGLHHSANITFGYFDLDKDIVLPVHHHIHEQRTHLIEGKLEFNINGDIKVLTPGMVAFIPSETPHSARALTNCKVIDCFLPVREDFVELEKNSVI
ncbi:MAG: cupin domain-containing protein [Bacteroidota bacterium]|nr:cupin domain-containing protein [Bacteroidota bacterium]